MKNRLVTRWWWLASAGLAVALPSCAARDTPVNPGYGYPPQGYAPGQAAGSVSVGEPSPYYVSSMPPEPLYEQMTVAPGQSSVWIDGSWHWNGFEWVWVNGRWERDQAGYVYVEPSYDYVADQFVYTPGYWTPPTRAPRGWIVRDHRDGRPTIIAPPVGNGGYRPPADRGPRPERPARPPVASPGGGINTPTPGGTFIPPQRPPRAPRPPVADPSGGGPVWKPPTDDGGGPVIFSGGARFSGARGGGAIAPARPTVGGTFQGPSATIDRPVAAPSSSPAGAGPAPTAGGIWVRGSTGRPAYIRPPAQRPGNVPPPGGVGGPIYVRPPAQRPGSAQPPGAVGGPIYVRPPAQSAGGAQPPPGGAIYVRPPAQQAGGAPQRPIPGGVYRPQGQVPAPAGPATGGTYARPQGAPAARPPAHAPGPTRAAPARGGRR